MAVPNLRIINRPSPEVVEMLLRRLSPSAKKQVEQSQFNSVALFNTSVPNVYYFADIAKKAGNVIVADVSGTCPQHVTALALFGDISAVSIAVKAIENAQ